MADTLTAQLTALATQIPQPEADAFADGVLRRLHHETQSELTRPGRPWNSPRRRFVIGLVFVCAIVAAAIALPGPRHTVARWFGLDRVRIERVPASVSATTPPEPASTVSATVTDRPPSTPSTVEVDDRFAELFDDLGPPVSPAIAAATGLPLPTPEALGAPMSLHVPDVGTLIEVVAVYATSPSLPASVVPGIGAIVSVVDASADATMSGKFVGLDTSIETLEIDGEPAIWLSGAPHDVVVLVDGQPIVDTLRLATNTLLWQHAGWLLRIEATISRDEAVRLARSWEPIAG
jgi:hypothetical protein